MANSPADVFARLSTTTPPTRTPALFGTAVVLGGSIAGLLAARVLSDHASTVVIIDRDDPQVTGVNRPGVPQSAQVHTLLPGGGAQLERWFPGFTAEAVDAGAIRAPAGRSASYFDGVRQVDADRPDLLAGSRPFLEGLIRARTLSLPNVKVVTGRVSGLEFAGDAVRGVRYAAGDEEGVEHADFVIDAMGRASRLGDWLEQNGWQRPPLVRMRTGVNYATAYFTRQDADPRLPVGAARFSPAAEPNGLSGAAVNAVDGDRWMIMLFGYGTDRPGTTEVDFRAHCRGLPPMFQEATSGKLVGDIQTYHQADSRRRDFHLTERLPARLVSVGDAVASFNPVYGQGMSSAALHASCLSEYLCSGPDLARPAREFFALQRVIVDAAWQTSANSDANRLTPTVPRSARARLQQWIGNQILAAAWTDPTVATRFFAVIFMCVHPSALAAPGIVLRAILANRRNRKKNQ